MLESGRAHSHHLTVGNFLQVIWPSAYRAWGLIGGAKVQVDSNLLNPKMQRPKRHAEDAFGTEEKSGAGLLPQAYDFGSSAARTDVLAPQASTAENRLLSHILGLDFPLANSATPYGPDYDSEWWSRDQTKPHTPDSSQSAMSPSPKSGSNHSSPAAAMPIPFSFDQARTFWDPPALQDMSVNYVTGA